MNERSKNRYKGIVKKVVMKDIIMFCKRIFRKDDSTVVYPKVFPKSDFDNRIYFKRKFC